MLARSPTLGTTKLSIDAYVVDVGHGNCCVIVSDGSCAVVDAGHGVTLLDFLDGHRITTVHALILSHADRDHIIGAQALLTSGINVESVFVNSDATKNTDAWGDLLFALEERFVTSGRRLALVQPTVATDRVYLVDGELEFLAPSISAALRGVGGKHAGVTLTSNSNSIVVRVWHNGKPRLLLTADVTEAAWRDLTNHFADVRAEVLVVPHHGGHVGRTSSAIGSMVDAVSPKIAIVSNDRGGSDTPRPNIVAEIQKRGCYIACTQFSRRCGDPGNAGVVAPNLPSLGSDRSACCAGSMRLTIEHDELVLANGERHSAFVDAASRPLCRITVAV
jgi:beta-lactamase superfamily II metal-dependent hydrolase